MGFFQGFSNVLQSANRATHFRPFTASKTCLKLSTSAPRFSIFFGTEVNLMKIFLSWVKNRIKFLTSKLKKNN